MTASRQEVSEPTYCPLCDRFFRGNEVVDELSAEEVEDLTNKPCDKCVEAEKMFGKGKKK